MPTQEDEEELPQAYPACKTKVVLEALKEHDTLRELGHRFQLNPIWKKRFLGGAAQVFGQGPAVHAKAHEQEKDELHQRSTELTPKSDR